LDPDFTHAQNDDVQAQQALDFLVNLIDANMQDIPLQRGDFCFIDNYKCVHGRQPFVANFDGHDRWLKRLNITTDLKKSSAYKKEVGARIIDGSPVFSTRNSVQ
ncbi:MAG: TauD/TfdA family dioxygenase, partial [Psychrosphaera sp.]|nr:TauD/TfdA family dioxygenase [Psychrosphaera sp.]